MKIELMDKFSFPETERQYTSEGYLIVPASISRPGTQKYYAKELVPTIDKLPVGISPEDVIVVYRPPEEVFKKESVDSFKNIPVTNNHPPEFLNSKNYRKYSVGVVLSDVSHNEKHVKATLKITDYEAVNEINEGKVEVSAGYNSNVYFTTGVTPEGEEYQAIQKDIIGNHIAVVKQARAGSEVRLADGLDDPSKQSEKRIESGEASKHKGSEPSETRAESVKRTSKGSEEEEELGSDGVPGLNISNPFGDNSNSSDITENKNKKELTMTLEDALKEITKLTEANERLSSQVLDQAGIDSLVEDRMGLIDVCSKVVDNIDYKGKSNMDLKKEVLMSKMPTIKLENKTNDYIDAAFDVLTADLEDTTEGKHDKDVYGEDLGIKDEGVTEPEGEEKSEPKSKNTHEGENPDYSGEDGANDEPDSEVETKDSVSVLDSAFGAEIKNEPKGKTMSAYEKYCANSRDAWKKK